MLKWIVITLLGIGWIAVPLWVGLNLFQNWVGQSPESMNTEEVAFSLLYAGIHLILFPLLTWWIYPALAWLMRSSFQHFFLRLIIKWMLAAGDTSSLFGHYKLHLSPEHIHEQGPKNETVYKMSAVQKLRKTNQHLFIYVSPLQAYIVPGRAFLLPEDFTRFVRTIEEWTQLKAVEI